MAPKKDAKGGGAKDKGGKNAKGGGDAADKGLIRNILFLQIFNINKISIGIRID